MKIYTAFTNADAIAFTARLVSELPVDLDRPNYVFCERRAGFTFEKELADRLGGMFNTEVLSFSRYVSKNVSVDKYLSKAQAALAVRRIMLEISDELYRIKPNSFSIPKDVYELISQLKAALVKPNDLQEILSSEGGVFGTKLKDIALIFEKYEEFLDKNGLTDESNFLSLMPDVVLNDPKIKGAKVIVAGLPSFTAQTVAIIKALSQVCDLDFVVVSANAECYTNETYFKLKKLFPDANVVACDSELSKESNAIALGLFEPSVFGRDKGACDGKNDGRLATNKVKINQALDVRDECMAIAKRIRYEVVNNGLRYRDFCVLCPSVATYQPVLKECFNLYDIAHYFDVTKALESHGVIALILGLIDIKRLSLLPSNLIATAKNGFFCGSEDGLAFEKYCLENAISRRSIKMPFNDLVAESVRGLMVEIHQKLPYKATISQYVQILGEVLTLIGFETRVNELCEKLKNIREDAHADFTRSAVKALYELLRQIEDVLGNVTVDLNELKGVILSATKAVEISTIPEYSDVVYVGDFKGGRLKKARVVFATSLTGQVPHFSSDTALLNDRELVKMDGYRLIIEPKLEIVNKREREDIAVALMSFTDKLFLSYPLLDGKGKPTVVSEIIDYFKSIFCQADGSEIVVKPQADDEDSFINYMSKTAGITHASVQAERFRENKTNDVKTLSAFLNAVDGPLKAQVVNLIQSDGEDKLCDQELSYKGGFSASAIERFFTCPYKAFAEGALKLKEAETGDAKVYEWGNILHGVMEKFILKLDLITDENSLLNLADQLVEEELKDPLYARYLNKAQYENIFKHVKIEARKECLKVYNDIKNSHFVPMGAELEFNESDKSPFKPLILKTLNGQAKLRGKIDRVDRFNDYFKIIDYKSGEVEDPIEESFYTGRKIQLYLYMNVLLNKGLKPAGAYYYKINDDYKDGGNDNAEFIGKTLEDKVLLKDADLSFERENQSKMLNVKLKADGDISVSNHTLNKNGFISYADYAIKVCESGANEMIKGMTLPAPYEGACKYCKLKGLCGYDQETGENTRELSGVNKQTIFDALKGDDNE